jgi:hypothetical protein
LSFLQAGINTVVTQIADLKARKQHYDDQVNAIADLRKQLADSRQAIISHITEYPTIIQMANEAINLADIQYKQAEIEIKKHKTRYYSALSEEAMQHVIILYKLFLDYKSQVDGVNMHDLSENF